MQCKYVWFWGTVHFSASEWQYLVNHWWLHRIRFTIIWHTYTQNVVLISCKSHIVHVINVGFIGNEHRACLGHYWIAECINWNFMAHVACVTKIRNTYSQKVVLISCKSHIVHVIDVGFIGNEHRVCLWCYWMHKLHL